MYRVYVLKQRKGGSEVLIETKTQTNSFAAASVAFWELYQQSFDTTHLLLMSKDNKKINVYRYHSKAGERDFLEFGANLNE